MMKKTAQPTLFAAAFVAGITLLGLASTEAQPASQDPLPDAQVMAELEAEVEMLSATLDEQALRIAKLEAALTRVAHGAEAMAKVLDESETLGFTAGINPESRHALLAGWRKQLDTSRNLIERPADKTARAPR